MLQMLVVTITFDSRPLCSCLFSGLHGLCRCPYFDKDLTVFVVQIKLFLCYLMGNEESREVCIKARSPPASLAFIGQVTKHTVVKWPIHHWSVPSISC